MSGIMQCHCGIICTFHRTLIRFEFLRTGSFFFNLHYVLCKNSDWRWTSEIGWNYLQDCTTAKVRENEIAPQKLYGSERCRASGFRRSVHSTGQKSPEYSKRWINYRESKFHNAFYVIKRRGSGSTPSTYKKYAFTRKICSRINLLVNICSGKDTGTVKQEKMVQNFYMQLYAILKFLCVIVYQV